ncbi:MAG: thermonuclease family protein [Pseudomonadota bacterium]
MSDFRLLRPGPALLAAALCACTPAEPTRAPRSVSPDTPCQVEQVYDGDSLRVRCDGHVETVRVYCIDAPEIGQPPWGERAHRRAQRALGGGTVTLNPVERDSYGRLVATVMADGNDLGETLVRDGLAVVYTRYCPRTAPIHTAEAAARGDKLGVWRTPGLHQTPWRWRHRAATH